MSRPTIRIHDLSTNEVVDREMNDDEFAQWETDQSKRAAEIVEQADKEAARQALLTKLGITDAEAKLLLS